MAPPPRLDPGPPQPTHAPREARSGERLAPWDRGYRYPELRWDEAPTIQFPAIRIDRDTPDLPPVPDYAAHEPQDDAPDEPDRPNSRLLASTGSIAIATLISRITGFAKQLLLLTTLGAAVASSFTVASQIPTMISEFVLGAVLTAIVVPVLVRAEREDEDKGAAFVRRLFTASLCLLGGAALLATAAAPLLVRFFLPSDGEVNVALSTALAYLLLPAIVFYGMTALLTAILNTRQVFRPGAWAPVLNNVTVLVVLALFWLTPGEISLDPVSMGNPKLLLLGLGVTAGVVVQVLSLVPAIRRQGISLKPLWGLDSRLKQFGGMAVAIVLYVAISQVGMIIATRVSAGADPAGPAIYTNAWLLLQLPYGVLGVTVLTAIMPRLSRNAAAEDTPAVVDDLSVATRLTMIALVPIVTFLTFAGPQVGEALYGYGNFGTDDASRLGQAVSWSAFTLIPYALVLIHLRVFYAREQAWTPTWIVLGITSVKIVLSLLVPYVVADSEHVVVGLGAANGLGYLVGAFIGGWLLHRSLGDLKMANVGRTVWIVVMASAVGAALTLGADRLVGMDRLSSGFGGLGSMVRVGISGVLMLLVTFAILWFAKIPEVVAITVAVSRRIRRLRGLPVDAAPTPEREAFRPDPVTDAETVMMPAIRVGVRHDDAGPRLPYAGRGHVGSGTGRSRAFEGEGVRVSDDDVTGATGAGRAMVDASERDSQNAQPDAPKTMRMPQPPGKSAPPRAGGERPGAAETPATDPVPTDAAADGPGSTTAPGSSLSGVTPGAEAPAGPEAAGADATGPDAPADPETPAGPDTSDAAVRSEAPGAGPADGTSDRDQSPARGGDQPAPTQAGPSVAPATAPVPPAAASGRGTPRGPKLIPGASVAGGRYRLLTPHGGARGLQFWQALDVKLDREVALTFVDADQRAVSTGPEGPQAILSRTLRLGRINSPGLARVLDVVRGSSGGIVVAEWTPGRSLREMAATTPSPIGAARAIRTLAAAAETAHRAGGALSIDHPDRVRISINGDAVLAFPGTLADADSATDVHGLGAMLYALITARWPLSDPNGAAGRGPATVGGLRPAELDSTGLPLAPRAVRPEVPFDISAVAVRSLEPNGGIRTAATVQHILDQATVVNDKTELIPALRLGQRSVDPEHSLSDPEALAAEKKKSNRMLIALAGLGVVTIVVLALLGFWLANFLTGSNSDAPLSQSDIGLTSEPAAPSAEAPTSAPPATPAAGTPVTPRSATVFSPQGTPDGAANARLAIDGDPATLWSTDAYYQPFPALKNGVGLMVTLPESVPLSKVSITSPTPGTEVEIRSATSTNAPLGQTQVIGTANLRDGVTEVPVTNDAPTQNVLVWITGLGSSGGQNQSKIAEIAIESAS
ncbi:murein biosynthesis integral membrane protein MurJ [Rhodococcus sp. HNM0569]|uniref:murein biosynthesis integral membrane protein MurJ n=1 Tax=Rhodococcus sp. HNM0569 TaxID=2716340 RepID=UPI00146E14CB|nr:murein biosynthesis integral membrane protein MurJ [Rhodococcus sp. HNM0569]NLU84496.1 murein biosynthesis integral membrane protein MurJ [Rhodococcus sp. HNM0569]